jgi:hypothetical protein
LLLVADGLIETEAGRPVSLHDVASHLLARAAAQDGQVTALLPEFTRRLLTLGVLLRPDDPDEDPLLNPLVGQVDPECGQPVLSLVRAVTAVELERSALLAGIVARRLEFLEGEDRQNWPARGLDWLNPLLQDTACQCLLVNSLASAPAAREPLVEGLWGKLLLLYEASQPDEDTGRRWPDGPLPACCALGLALVNPGDPSWLEELEIAASWGGWPREGAGERAAHLAEALWPTRHPGKDLPALRETLTERALVVLKLPDRKLWRRERVKRLLPVWPPLATFCVDLPPSTK